MSAFQPPFLFSLYQLSHLPFMGHHNFDTNALFHQNHCSMANMNSNDSNRIPINTLNASPSSSPMEMPKISSFLQEIPTQNPSSPHSQGKWTQREENLYNEFTKLYSIHFPSGERLYNDRKRRFYFNAMSSFIGTRNSTQCKSHDQKVRERLGLSFKETSLRSTKAKKKNLEKGEDHVMINFDAIGHMDMMPSRGMMKQITGMEIEPVKKKSDDDNVDRFFNFGSDEHQQSSGANYDPGYHYRGVGFNSEFGRSYSLTDENFNLDSRSS